MDAEDGVVVVGLYFLSAEKLDLVAPFGDTALLGITDAKLRRFGLELFAMIDVGENFLMMADLVGRIVSVKCFHFHGVG